jgi:hypothetical protein
MEADYRNDLRDALQTLASFSDTLSAERFSPGEFVAAREMPDGSIHIGYSSLSAQAEAFIQAVYDRGWVQPFSWINWQRTPEATRLLEDREYLAAATPEQLSRLLTTIIRRDRFTDGVLLSEFQTGVIAAIAARAKALVDQMQA